jgi:hypothetical protein
LLQHERASSAREKNHRTSSAIAGQIIQADTGHISKASRQI